MGCIGSMWVGVCCVCMDGVGLWFLCVGACVGGVGFVGVWVYGFCGCMGVGVVCE